MFQNRLGIDRDKGSIDYIVGMYDDGVIPTTKGHRTAEELETALEVASRLEEA